MADKSGWVKEALGIPESPSPPPVEDAELERLIELVRFDATYGCDPAVGLAALRSYLSADTRRLEWIMERGAKVEDQNSSAEDGEAWLCKWRTFHVSFQGEMHFAYGASARAAIDSAMQERNDG